MRNPEDKITQAIDLYFSNLSSRKVRNHFRRHIPDIYWVNVDWDSRYINATHYNTITQDLEEATEFMKKSWFFEYINA